MKNKNIKLPDAWGEGIIFAYSGIDGETEWRYPFVATTLFYPPGLLFRTKPERMLLFPEAKLKNKKGDIVTSDLISFSHPSLSLIFFNKDTVIGKCASSVVPEVVSGEGVEEKREGNRILQSNLQSHTVLIWEKNQNETKFAYAFDEQNIQIALRKAQKGLKADFCSEKTKKLSFFRKLPAPEFSNALLERTYYKAFSVLKVNVESPQGKIKHTWTTPDRFPHKDMWLWDSAFHTLGNRFISSSLAEDSIKAILSNQRKDGFISHQMNPINGRASQFTQPPVLAWASYKIYQQTKDKEFLKYVYPKLKKFLNWLYQNRDNDKTGLLAWKINSVVTCKCGESGMDNSPRFDKLKDGESIKSVDFNSFAINEMEYLGKMAQELNRKEEAILWREEAGRKKRLFNLYLWDKEDKFYYDLKKNSRFNKIKTVASFLPLFAGIADKSKAEDLVKRLKNPDEFWTEFPVPSVSIDSPFYHKDMWRGPTWINYNYLIIEGLKKYGFTDTAIQLANKTLREIARWYKEKGTIFEYYDSESSISPDVLLRKQWLDAKKPIGAIKEYHWTAAVYIALSLSK